MIRLAASDQGLAGLDAAGANQGRAHALGVVRADPGAVTIHVVMDLPLQCRSELIAVSPATCGGLFYRPSALSGLGTAPNCP